MDKAAFVAPFYVSVAWTAMVTYQMFTQTAVSTTLTFLSALWPTASAWLLLRMDMIVFIYAFSWVFVLSSVIPSLLLRKKRSVLAQFFLCLALAIVAFVVQDYVNAQWSKQSSVLLGAMSALSNPLLALGFLSMPFIFMLVIDIRDRRTSQRSKQSDEFTAQHLEYSEATEQETNKAVEEEQPKVFGA
jgi:hypothetical protein